MLEADQYLYAFKYDSMLLTIKNMVCDRCIMVVRQQLEHLGFRVEGISLGKAEVSPDPSEQQTAEIASALKLMGFELINKEKDKLVERIRTVIIEALHHTDAPELHINFPQLLAGHLHRDYGYLSRVFSESEDITIERFIIQQKIEKVKELLQYGELNVNEIAFKMGYSSSAHLSGQFKMITGQSPREFKAMKVQERKPLDKI